MDYVDAATTGTLSPHILPKMDLQKMLFHIKNILPSTLQLSVSPEDTHSNLQQTVPSTYGCTHSGQIETDNYLQGFHH